MTAVTKAKLEKAANTAIWEALGKTDPAHTKPFSRAGGFKGTALKPIWIVKRLTEQFGPIGQGWGMGKPDFQIVDLVESTGKVMVYCTVECWHTHPENTFYGVGGDTVQDKFNSGKFAADDEAFKKAFTDAVNNAFKFVGVGADIHMGQFDDSKYVAAVAREFAEGASNGEQDAHPKAARGLDGPITSKAKLHEALCHYQREINRCGDDDTLTAFIETDKDYVAFVNQCERDAPHYLHGGEPAPPEFVGLFDRIKQMRDEFQLENAQ